MVVVLLLLRSIISRMSFLILILFLLTASSSSSSSSAPKLYLPGASGSGPFETLKDWVAAFEAKYPEADLSVSSVGSGAAQAALWGDINCEKKPIDGLCPSSDESESSDSTNDNQTQTQPYKSTFWGMGGGTIDNEHYLEHASRGLQQLPALGGPILITYSKDVTRDLGAKTSQQLNLNFETVAGIFNNTIRRWNHPSIKADNPLLDLPSDSITVVVRSDKSGMTQTLTEGIHHANPETWPEDAVGKTPTWPLANLTHATETSDVCMDSNTGDYDLDAQPSRGNNIQADGQTGIGISLLRRPSSVGYLELGYFSTLTQFVAQAHVSSPTHPTIFVPATVETLKLTMGGLADMLEPETLSLTLVDQDTPLGGYPISRYVYWYIKKMAGEYESCYQAWLVFKFIEWTYTDPLAEEIALGHGWVVPPESVVEKALTKLGEVQCVLEEGDAGSGTVAYQSSIDGDSDTTVNNGKDGDDILNRRLQSESVSKSESDRIIFVADYVPLPYREVEYQSSEEQSYLVVILVPIFVVALLAVAAILGYLHVERKRRQADAVWKVLKSDLDMGDGAVIKFLESDAEDSHHSHGAKIEYRHCLGELIGQGTFGSVVLAEYRGTLVAVKRVLPEVKPASLEHYLESGENLKKGKGSSNPGLESVGVTRTLMSGKSTMSSFWNIRRHRHMLLKKDFIREMRQLAKLRHPNITTTIGAVMDPGEEPMMVMEYMHNGSLYDAIRNETINLNSHEDILTIVQDVAHGLRFLHSAHPQVIHGDLKTKNVLIDANFRAKVADFGLSGKDKNGARGTPYWMAPELLTKQTSNTIMSDVYAFGILLYEVYSRKTPYEGEDYEEVIRLICDPSVCKRPPVPSICQSKIANLMMNCLEANPEDRPRATEIDKLLQAEGTIQGRVFRIEALNQELSKANQKISTEHATQLSHFASMSHEIRTPLNCIIGISSLLETDDNLDLGQRDTVNMIVQSGQLLRHVVDEVLDFSKFVSGNAEIDIKRTNLQETLSTIITSMKLSPITERKQISMETMFGSLVPQYIETDDRRLQQIMYNLLSNATKFSPDNGKIELSVSVGSRYQNAVQESKNDNGVIRGASNNQRSEVRICVKDYGKGIDESEFEKIFQPFSQTVSGMNNVDGGTGLGLAITQQLVQLLGGSISVDSEVGEWTKFSLKLPLTGSLADTRVVTKKLRNCSVWLVSNKDDETKYIVDTCDYFKVKQYHCQSMKQLEESLESNNDRTTGYSNVCVIQEDLYDDFIYGDLSTRGGAKTILITFGSTGDVTRASVHYKSFTAVFPLVFMQELDSLCNYNTPTQKKIVKHERMDNVKFESLKILVAEDNKVNQKVIVRLLERIGVNNVVVVGNGREAVDREAAEAFDIIFMDVQMPIMDGIEACKLIVARTELPPKVVFLTAHVVDGYKDSCIANGATDFMTKPCTIGDLKTKLEMLVNMPFGGI